MHEKAAHRQNDIHVNSLLIKGYFLINNKGIYQKEKTELI